MINNAAPLAAIIVPMRDRGDYINILLGYLTKQDYPNYFIIIVGDKKDTTWGFAEQQYKDNPRIIYTKALIKTKSGRDTNERRTWGGRLAIRLGAKYLFYTDSKIQMDPDWLSKGVRFIEENGVDAVAGVMLGTPKSLRTFWGSFSSGTLKKRGPDVKKDYLLNVENFGKNEALPLTSNLGLTADAFKKMKGFPKWVSWSYEDFCTSWQAVKAGVKILMTSKLVVLHEHRQGFRAVSLEYARSAYGAWQMRNMQPDCPFGKKREKQVRLVISALTSGIGLAIVLLILEPIFLLLGFVAVLASFCAAGVYNAKKIGHWWGLIFPAMTVYFIIWFALNYTKRAISSKVDPNDLLQTIFELEL